MQLLKIIHEAAKENGIKITSISGTYIDGNCTRSLPHDQEEVRLTIDLNSEFCNQYGFEDTLKSHYNIAVKNTVPSFYLITYTHI